MDEDKKSKKNRISTEEASVDKITPGQIEELVELIRENKKIVEKHKKENEVHN